MPITVVEPGPDGTLMTVPDPQAASPPTPEVDTAGASAPPPAPAASPAQEAPPASAPDVSQRSEVSEAEDEEDASAPPVPRTLQRRMDRERRLRGEAERREAALKARVEMLEQGYRRPEPDARPAEVPLHQQPEPREEDYGSQQEWFRAVREWDKAQLKAELAREQYEARQRQQQQAHVQQMASQAQAARQKYADFDQVMDRLSEVYTSPALDTCVHASDLGAELAYYLAQHPEEITRLNEVAREQPLAMAREVGRLEARLASPPATNGTPPRREPPSPKPEPVSPVSGAGNPGPAEPDFDTMSQREFEAWWKRTYPGMR